MQTRGTVARTQHILAILSREPKWTQTSGSRQLVLTVSTIHTQTLTGAVPDVTIWPRPSRKAVAQVSSDQVATRAGVDAYIHFTLIGVQLTRPAGPPRRAETQITSGGLLTRRSSTTRAAVTLPDGICAGESRPAFGADAAEARWVFHTCRPIHTWR